MRYYISIKDIGKFLMVMPGFPAIYRKVLPFPPKSFAASVLRIRLQSLMAQGPVHGEWNARQILPQDRANNWDREATASVSDEKGISLAYEDQ
jgi:hypothetical protein